MQRSLARAQHKSTQTPTKTTTKRKISTKSKRPTKSSTKHSPHRIAKRAVSTGSSALLERTKKYPLCTVSTLPSGLTVATEHTTGALASVSVAINAGSRFENDDNNGSAHFLEHCFFKGTKKRTRHQIDTLVENIGGSLNAYTTREQVVFTITTQRDHLPIGVELLSDMILNSKVDNSAVEGERSVILQEYDSVANELQETTYDLLHSSVFKGSSLAYTILGPIPNIKKITQNDVATFRRVHYTAPKMLVTGAGDFTHDEFQQLIDKNFATLPTAPPEGIVPNPGQTPTWNSDMAQLDDVDEYERLESAMAIAFPTPGANHPDHIALMVLQMMLASVQSSLDGSVAQPFNTQYSDHSLFGLYLQTPRGEMVEHAKSSVKVLSNLLKVAHEGVAHARDTLKSALFAQYEGSEEINHEVARQILLHGRRLHPTELYQRIENVDVAAVERVANTWFNFDNMSAAVVGPDEDVPDLQELKNIAKGM